MVHSMSSAEVKYTPSLRAKRSAPSGRFAPPNDGESSRLNGELKGALRLMRVDGDRTPMDDVHARLERFGEGRDQRRGIVGIDARFAEGHRGAGLRDEGNPREARLDAFAESESDLARRSGDRSADGRRRLLEQSMGESSRRIRQSTGGGESKGELMRHHERAPNMACRARNRGPCRRGRNEAPAAAIAPSRARESGENHGEGP